MLILLIAFGSVIAMGLPIGMALFGLALGISSMSLITYLIDIPSWAPVVGSMVGLGVGIDYALFLVTRHREYLARGMTVEESVGRAVATAGQSVVFAGGTVVIAILGLAVAGVPFMTAGRHRHLGDRADHGALLGDVAAGVPRARGPSDQRLRTPTQPAPPQRRGGSGLAALGWTRVAARPGVRHRGHRRAARTGRTGAGAPDRHPGRGRAPVDRTERRAYDLVADGFGPGINGPLVVAVDISKDPSVVDPLASAIRADAGVASVAPPEVNADAGVATLVAFPTTGPQDSATLDTVDAPAHRRDPGRAGAGPARAHIGGQTASFADVGDKVNSRLPLFIGAVIVLSVLLLTLVFRSVVVPIKAALLNLLSVGAAFGVIVMVFQWGWGAGLIGLESTIPIVPFIPMFMFAILFGLSMDYEVFLLSRVREEYLLTGDNDRSVIHGIATTGRVITSRRADHDLGVPGVRPGLRSHGQGARTRPGNRDPRRRDHRPTGPAPGNDEAAGRRQLVDPAVARPAAADHQRGGRRRASRP